MKGGKDGKMEDGKNAWGWGWSSARSSGTALLLGLSAVGTLPGEVCGTGAVLGCTSGRQDAPLGSDTPWAPSRPVLTMMTLPSPTQVLRVPVSLPMWEQFVITWT